MQPALDLQRQKSDTTRNENQSGSGRVIPASSTYTLPPLQFDGDVTLTEGDARTFSSQTETMNPAADNSPENLQFGKDERLVDHTMSSEKQWTLPTPQYHISGEIVLLRKDRSTIPEDGKISRMLRAFSPTQAQYNNLLYTGVKTHSRTYYQDRILLLGKGNFNSTDGWKSKS
jgi:hypothetical protein